MRTGFISLITIVLASYSLANFYVIWRTWVMLPGLGWGIWRWVAALAILGLAVAYPVSRIAEAYNHPWASTIGVWVGSFWIAALVYFFLIFLALHFFDGVAWLSSRPGGWVDRWIELRPVVWGVVVVAVALLIGYGHWNACRPRVVPLEWALPRLPQRADGFRIVAISDVHCGAIIGRARVEQMVAAVNAQKPDLILLVGDTIDGELKPVKELRLGEILRKLSAPHGVYAVNGNHEFFGGVEENDSYLELHGIRLLRDETVEIAGAFMLVGREDISITRWKRDGRASLAALLSRADQSLPVVVMDHQPVAIDEAAAAGADIQLSGHTHDGQFWPMGYIPKMLFKLSHGYEKFGPLNAFVTCGIGTWGPPVRIGNTPEILVITLRSGAAR